MLQPSFSRRILPLLKDAFAPLGFFLAETWQAVAPLTPDPLVEQLTQLFQTTEANSESPPRNKGHEPQIIPTNEMPHAQADAGSRFRDA